jgi:hypothetical protein
MADVQLTAKEDLCRRILNLPVETIEWLSQCLDDFEAHEPNDETIEVLEDSEAGRNLSRVYDNVEEMLSDLIPHTHIDGRRNCRGAHCASVVLTNNRDQVDRVGHDHIFVGDYGFVDL